MKLWKALVGLFFVLVIVDGALRKWLLPGQSQVLYAAKDVVLWTSLLAFAWPRSLIVIPRPLRATPVPLLLAAYLFLVAAQSFNPRMPALTLSVLGLKAHLAYLPLVVLVPALIADAAERQALRLLWGYVLLVVVPLVALSVYQFFQPPTAWINQYVREMGTVATAGGHPRVTATFSYIGSHTAYLTFNAFLSAGVLLAWVRNRRREYLALGAVLFSATLVVLPMAGSRGPVVIVLVALAALLTVAESSAGRSLRFLAAALLIGVVLIQGVGGIGLAEGWDALAERAVSAGDTQSRIAGMLRAPFEGMERAGLFGYGAGSAHQAAPRLVSGAVTHHWLPEGYIESGIARSVIELGSLGWVLLMTLKGALLYLAFRTVRRSRRPLEVLVSATAFCMLLAYFPFPVIYNAVAGAFYWGSAGGVLGVWSLQEARIRAFAQETGSAGARRP